jgi:transaldolase
LLPLCRASLLRSAPFELPQGGNEARVEGCSGAIKVACPFFSFLMLRTVQLHLAAEIKLKHMKFFIDTANLAQIKEAQDLGVLDGVTTNPSLMAKEGITGDENVINHYKAICDIVDDNVSAEVIATDFEGIVKEGEALAALNPKIVVKVPMIKDGIKAIKYFSGKGIRTNCTLIFSPGQALLAAKAGASYVSPFLGRLDDISTDGLQLIEDIRLIFDNYGYPTEILAASIRGPLHIVACAKLGADVITAPLAAITALLKHPLTDSGLATFLADHAKASGK